MNFHISTWNDGGSGMKYRTKEEALHELSLMIDDCIENGGSFMDIMVDADASCFYVPKDDEKDDEEEDESVI